jgi:hypothetical protein
MEASLFFAPLVSPFGALRPKSKEFSLKTEKAVINSKESMPYSEESVVDFEESTMKSSGFVPDF